MSPVRLQCAVCVMGKGGAHVVIASPRWEELHRCAHSLSHDQRCGRPSVQLKQKLTFRFHDSRASAVPSSSVKRFHYPFTPSLFRQHSAFCFVVKAGSACCELLLQTTQDDTEEKQEVTASLATANRISMDVNTGRYFQIKRKHRAVLKTFGNKKYIFAVSQEFSHILQCIVGKDLDYSHGYKLSLALFALGHL